MRIDSCLPQPLLQFVSDMFGPFDPRLDFMGVEWTTHQTPCTAYPEPFSQFRIKICLPNTADEDWKVARCLAHELVHCLTPNGPPSFRATVLEEGLAEHCAVAYLRASYTISGIDFDWADAVQGAHRTAFDLVEEAVRYEGLEGMRERVRAMRLRTGLPFAELSAEALGAYFTATPEALRERLSQKFSDL